MSQAVSARSSARSSALSRDREDGAGTVLIVGLVVVLTCMIVAVVLLLQAVNGAARAATAADLAALAGADAARDLIPGDPCTVAADVAGAHGAELVRCLVSGQDLDVVDVQTRLPLPAPLGAASGRARAGPPP
ncbi:MAG: Rv3654c family TadE-like protein [Actinomycetales bacterium]|jgi:secretion/DNA translocation related TadE-like protein